MLMEQTTESKHPVGIQAFGRSRRGKRLLALTWIVLFLLFQSGVGIHVRNCGHCCSHEKAVCHTHQECPGHHSHQQCHNCPSCFKLLKLTDFFPSEKWNHMPVHVCNVSDNLLRVCRTEVPIAESELPVEEKGDPPSRAGSSRFIHFCHQNTLYA